MTGTRLVSAPLTKGDSSAIPRPYITHEYIDAVLQRMIYCVRSTVNRWQDQSAYRFSSSGISVSLPALISVLS